MPELPSKTANPQVNLEEFQHCVSTHYKFPLASLQVLSNKLRKVTIPAQQSLWQAGDTLNWVYFLNTGLLYAFFETIAGKLFCKEMYWEHDLIFGFRSLLLNAPLRFSVKAIEHSVLFAIHIKDYQQAILKDDNWKTFHHNCVQQYYLNKETKEEFLLLNTPQERVRFFYQEYPELTQRVPQHIIASYLGITPISLSRIKNRLTR